jgi:hypothetical protein
MSVVDSQAVVSFDTYGVFLACQALPAGPSLLPSMLLVANQG